MPPIDTSQGDSSLSDDGPNPMVRAAAQAQPVVVSEDRLRTLRDAVAKVRDLELTKKSQEEGLKATNVELQEQYFKKLPDLMDQVGVPKITLAAEGNMPAVVAEAKPYYHAVISSEWPEEARAKAFKLLEDGGHGDLIRTEVVISFARESHNEAIEFAQQMSKEGLNVTVNQNVHWATLTAWLKEMVEKHRFAPTLEILETIGATIGRVVKLSPTKDK